MNPYLKCLHDYVSAHSLVDAHLSIDEYKQYQHCAAAYDDALDNLKNSLDPSQTELMKQFEAAQMDFQIWEDMLMFLSSVRLGKWLACL